MFDAVKRCRPVPLRAAAALVAAALCVVVTTRAAAITYRVLNHPDGGSITDHDPDKVGTEGYILRVDTRDRHNTFNANQTRVLFNWEPGTDRATLSGDLFHNESGSDNAAFDGGDDRWHLDATFRAIALADEPGTPWYGSNPTTATYDDMLRDLYRDGNVPDTAAERSGSYDANLARIYWHLVDATLSPRTPGPLYDGPVVLDEFPNNDIKPFFFQYRWRLWNDRYDGSEFDLLAAAGWLDEPGGQSDRPTQDFLLVIDPGVTIQAGPPIPEPLSAGLCTIGLGALGMCLWRRRG